MQLFANYLEPLTAWLHLHPYWSLFLAFFIAFIESLAFLGSIIPGTVVMTALGILAGSGVMRIDLTFIFAALGAIIGDVASYGLGYKFSDRLLTIWPFSRYPTWLEYGQNYFDRHGTKSIFLGRFIGPLRSIIPVVAGMMRMKQLPFLTANIMSGIAWSIVYVTPGVLIGSASSELSAEGATRLFLFILILLGLVWFVSVVIKWLFAHVSSFCQTRLHYVWAWLEDNRLLSRLTRPLTPPNEGNHAATAALLVSFIFSISIIVSIFLWFIWIDELGDLLDLPIYFFFQSLRTQPMDMFFVIIRCLIDTYPLLVFSMMISLNMIYRRNWRLLKYWLSLAFISLFMSQAMGTWMNCLRPEDAALFQSNFSHPSASLTLATALWGFLMLHVGRTSMTSLTRTLRLIWLSLLGLDGIAVIYLGEHWLTSTLMSFTMGVTLALGHWILYRRHVPKTAPRTRAIWLAFGLFIAVGMWVTTTQYKAKLLLHTPYPEQYMLTNQAWWYQREPLLPQYTMNRFGHPNGVFNIQYLGSLDVFQKALESHGWRLRPNSFAKRFLEKTNHLSSAPIRALKTPLYLNKKPELVMTYDARGSRPLIILSMWPSNYHLHNHDQPIWLGSLSTLEKSTPLTEDGQTALSSFQQILPALKEFEFTTLPLPTQPLQSPSLPAQSLLLMIKEIA
ncbi:MAG: VTT domain-containing protein [Legionellaceae bacterium]|nr:VTT domain-containing protein [Legionellaceae bacterium]